LQFILSVRNKTSNCSKLSWIHNMNKSFSLQGSQLCVLVNQLLIYCFQNLKLSLVSKLYLPPPAKLDLHVNSAIMTLGYSWAFEVQDFCAILCWLRTCANIIDYTDCIISAVSTAFVAASHSLNPSLTYLPKCVNLLNRDLIKQYSTLCKTNKVYHSSTVAQLLCMNFRLVCPIVAWYHFVIVYHFLKQIQC